MRVGDLEGKEKEQVIVRLEDMYARIQRIYNVMGTGFDLLDLDEIQRIERELNWDVLTDVSEVRHILMIQDLVSKNVQE